jgi:NAD(P)-dependent dehydrogenase (short-subunit alcohol dehydrogenase family)
MRKIALITGANKGIGFETARQLAVKGYTVLLSARDEGRGKHAVDTLQRQGLDAHLIMMNPTQSHSVRAAKHEVTERFGVLDVLINNAGTMVQDDMNPPSRVSLAAFRETFELNVFALHEVTSAFWDLLCRSEAARLVNVSSILGSLTKHADGTLGDFKAIAYDASKAAVNMMTLHYAHQWRGTPHKANTIHPGSVKTDLNPSGHLSVDEGARTSVELATIGEDGPNGGFFYMGTNLPW